MQACELSCAHAEHVRHHFFGVLAQQWSTVHRHP
jgi:hypothetical protein